MWSFFLRHHVPIIHTDKNTMKQHLSAGSVWSDCIVLSQLCVKVNSDDFSKYATSGSNATWTPFNPTLMDSGIVTNTKGLLVLNSTKQPFMALPNLSMLNHVKYLAFKNSLDLLNSKIGGVPAGLHGAYATPNDGHELVFEGIIAAQLVSQHNPACEPLLSTFYQYKLSSQQLTGLIVCPACSALYLPL